MLESRSSGQEPAVMGEVVAMVEEATAEAMVEEAARGWAAQAG